MPTQKSNKLLFITIILAVLLAATTGFGYWAFMGMQDYKNNADKKVAAAVAAAEKAQAAKLQAGFDEQSKAPHRTYSGSPTYGSISFSYPRTWSAYVDESSGSQPIDGFFHPVQVPSTQSESPFALRLELINQEYTDAVGRFQSGIDTGKVKASAYLPPKLKDTANATPGMLLTGDVLQDSKSQGTMLIIKVRDKTLQVYTESNSYAEDFNSIILPSLAFAP